MLTKILKGVGVLLVLAGIFAGGVYFSRYLKQNQTTKLQEEVKTELEEIELGKVITIANGEWTPYFSEELKYYGVVSRIVKDAFALEGVEVEFVFMPWKRGMEDSKNGELHGTQGWGKTEERMIDFYYSAEPIMLTQTAIFHRKDYSFDWEEFDDLENLEFSGTAGYFYGAELEHLEDTEQITVDRGPEDRLNFLKLVNKRTNLVLNDVEVGNELIKDILSSEQIAQITHHSKLAGSFDCHLLLSKHVEGNEELMQVFNRGMKRLKDSGLIDQYWSESRAGDYKIK